MNNLNLLGIDLAKNIFQLHGIDEKGNCVLKRRLRRKKLIEFTAQLSRCIIAMEVCGGSYYWARKFREMGHEVKLISPQYVKPYVKTNKNDQNDAEAICEAASRPSMRYVPIKNIMQQDTQIIHRIRSRYISSRTSLMNQIRGILAEYGVIIAQGKAALKREIPIILADSTNELSYEMRVIIENLMSELRYVDEKIETYENKIKLKIVDSKRCQRLLTVPGIGPLTATALDAAVGDAGVFKKGRQMSAWLGLVPKQNSSGEKTRLSGISKRGDRYLRCLLIHGGRSVVKVSKKKTDLYSLWINKLVKRVGMKKAIVAIANKNARIAWAVMKYGKDYNSKLAASI